MVPRKPVTACYDHLGGIAGERITNRMLELGWITGEPNPGLTPAGYTGLGQLGLDLSPLGARRRKAVCLCTERRGDRRFDHLGGHLGALLRQHMLDRGWLRQADERLELTPDGERVLRDLGVNLEENS